MSIDNLNESKYKEGFVTDVESESFPPGLDEQVVRNLSALNDEPEWLGLKHIDVGFKWKSLTGVN